MKKRGIVMTMAALMMVSAATGRTGRAVSGDGTFTPKETINWAVTSSSGGGSDIYTKMISDVMAKENLVNGQPIIVTNKIDGSDEIDRNEVTTIKGNKVNYTLLTLNSGDLMPIAQNTKNRSFSFRVLAIIAVDKQLIFKGEQTKYTDFKEAIEVTKDGTKIVIGGSKGDGIATYDAALEEIGISKGVMSYITYDSTGDTIATALGDHVEFVISRPAAASEYVTAGSLIPMLVPSAERHTGSLAGTPTLSEIGSYESVGIPVWRDMTTPAAMSNAAATYQSKQSGKVAEADTWKDNYLEKNKLTGNYMGAAGVTEYVTAYEKDFMAASGIQ